MTKTTFLLARLQQLYEAKERAKQSLNVAQSELDKIDNEIARCVSYLAGSEYYEFAQDNDMQSYTSSEQSKILLGAPETSNPNQGNGFGNPPTKSTDEIIKEIKAMIVELQIKGSVRKRPNGLIEYRSGLLGSIYGRSKEEIEKQLTQKLKEARKCKTKKEKVKTPLLSEFFHSDYLPYKKTELSENSIKGYMLYIRRFTQDNFDKPLNKYTSTEIEKYLLAIPQTRTRQVIRGVFNNIFDYAKRIGAIKINPCDNVEQVKHKKKNGRALSFDAQAQFIDNLVSLANENEKRYLLFVYLTGTRRAEAMALTSADVDTINKVIHIPGTKTEGSNRFMPLTPLVEKLLHGINPTNGKFFDLSKTRPDTLMERLTNEEYHLHDLRHTFGTIKICMDKLDAKTVSLWMGHTTVLMTLTTYTHPEQLNPTLFYDGSKTEEEKLAILKEQYARVLSKIENIL